MDYQENLRKIFINNKLICSVFRKISFQMDNINSLFHFTLKMDCQVPFMMIKEVRLQQKFNIS